MYKKIGTSSIASALLLASASCFAQTTAPVTVNFGNQINSGNITSGMILQNIVAGTVVLGSRAIGNAIDVNTLERNLVINGGNAIQTNSGSTNASIMVSGPATQFNALTANVLSAGNTQSFVSTSASTGGINSVTAASQINSGTQGASLNWSQDPTGQAFLNSTALGNSQAYFFTK